MKYTFLNRFKRVLRFWHWREQSIALLITWLAFTVLGPFETSAMPVGHRALYWLLCIGSGWGVVLALLSLVLMHPRFDEWSAALRVACAISLASIPIGLIVMWAERTLRGHAPAFTIMINVFFVCALIGGLMYLRVMARLGLAEQTLPKHTPTFFARLPSELGTAIISLSAQDHYVEVTTTKGSTLILLGLSEAIEELAGLDGLQIHRSHWVAKKAARKLRRKSGKLMLELVDTRLLPISRTYGPTVRKVLA
ncbi:MAG: LytTR family transcriptional regulator [Rhodobacteraceae bacterium]|nr:LytTR family transcriptional regulator [Paracoccaceae bacterium]